MSPTSHRGGEALTPEHDLPERVVVETCLKPTSIEVLDVLHGAITSPHFRWGELLSIAIQQRVLCLVADTLETTGLIGLAPVRLARHLQRTQRCNLHSTAVHRSRIGTLTAVALRNGLLIATCKGIAVEDVLYGGRGAREFSDLDVLIAPDDFRALEDLLVDLGYKPHRCTTPFDDRRAAKDTFVTWSIATGDTIKSHVIVDLTCEWPGGHGRGHDFVRSVLRRAHLQALPGYPNTPIPALAPMDQITLVEDLMAAARARGHTPKATLVADRHRMLARWLDSPRAEVSK